MKQACSLASSSSLDTFFLALSYYNYYIVHTRIAILLVETTEMLGRGPSHDLAIIISEPGTFSKLS